MRHFGPVSLFALAVGILAAPGLAQDAAPTPTPAPGGFRLPTNPTPTPTDIQGPVDPDAPILTRPRTPTPTPTPRATAAPAPTPAPAATPTQRAILPPRSSTLPPRFTPPAAADSPAAEAIADSPAPFPSAAPGAEPSVLPPVSPGAESAASPAASDAPVDEGTPGWLFALVGLLALAVLGAGAFFLRRRSGVSSSVAVPVIEKPRISGGQGASPPAPAIGGPPLIIEAKVRQLARSVMFATLTYDVRVTNRGAHPLENVSFGGDFVTAHARVPADQQLADPSVALTPVQSLTKLDPGESASFSGEFRLPVSEIRPIPHGTAVVYVPLLRVRAEADGMEPIARTFIVGLKSPGASQRLQPFRLDEMPQTYHAVGQKALD
ncbi:hypothetical protein A6F68_01529 [Tsuneonella dongtanensis]|uniref:LPXTG cell wall anchor domain-containing protein n=1 Tax=Tsuneonella dongtanensis TaxID=692370 RepID=A0A1B2AD50_9SPHN|nr:hypothetical protein [Tsuneonella dongtanensis]ANY20044.1 hypothetical protein A6F68_01529 [Tsuneonella dongtanensis]